MQRGLDESLRGFEAAIKSNPSNTLVLAVKGTIAAPEKNRLALAEAFGEPSTDETNRQIFIIPTDKITAVKALAYPASEGNPEPALSLRIKTGTESPTRYYAGPGTIGELESPGSWYQFSFEDINVALLSPISTAKVA
jgi:hypothetical protein